MSFLSSVHRCCDDVQLKITKIHLRQKPSGCFCPSAIRLPLLLYLWHLHSVSVLYADGSPIASHQQDDGDVDDDMTIREVSCMDLNNAGCQSRGSYLSQRFSSGFLELGLKT